MSDNILRINMLGTFSLCYGGKTLDDSKRTMKLWMLLEYLIAFRDRGIPQSELIELLWPESQSNNPVNALKTMIHRLRALLTELGYVNGKDMILQKRGSYIWNTKLPMALDVEQFEQHCKAAEAHGASDATVLDNYLKAIELYKGDFLPKSGAEAWAAPIRTYYHVMYTTAVKQTVELLKKAEKHREITEVCTAALAVNPYNEFLHYHLINSLNKLGRQQDALNHYESMSDLMYNYFGVTSSEEMAALYREIIKENRNVEEDLRQIKEQLKEKEGLPGAFFCKYDFFKDIYRVQARAVARSGMSIYICLISVTDKQGCVLDGKHLNTAMARLGGCVRESLRKGDVYSRYSASQYIIMLPSVAYEDSRRIIERILNRYRSRHSYADVSFSYNMEPVEASG